MTELPLITHGQYQILDMTSQDYSIESFQDALDLIGTAAFGGATHVLLGSLQLPEDFFDLSTGSAGEILQKFTTYRVGLFVVGDIGSSASASLKAFITESNRGEHINFVADRSSAFTTLSARSSRVS